MDDRSELTGEPAEPTEIRSYTSVDKPAGGWLRESLSLVRSCNGQNEQLSEHVRELIERLTEVCRRVREWGGVEIKGLDVLDIGPGQLPRQMAFFAVHNRVTGIDLDVVPQGWNIADYFRLFRQNGFKRLAKTIGRKALGFDRRFRREMARQLSVGRLPATRVIQVDVAREQFADESFDFVYSFDTFEHIADPAAALREAKRLLRPGGVCYVSLHPLTAEDGFHDLRIIQNQREGLPLWAHLRRRHQNETFASAFLNRLPLDAWRRVFESVMPGGRVHLDMMKDEMYARELAKIRNGGELNDYTDDELLLSRIVYFWKKP